MDEVMELIDAFLVEMIGRHVVTSAEVADRLLDIRLAAAARTTEEVPA